MLVPPPLPLQPLSLLVLPLELSVSDVPPTPITLGSLDGVSACTGPLVSPAAPSPGVDPPSPDEAKTWLKGELDAWRKITSEVKIDLAE